MREKPEEVTKECLIKKLMKPHPLSNHLTERDGKFPINSKDWKDNCSTIHSTLETPKALGSGKSPSLVLLVAGERTYEEERANKKTSVWLWTWGQAR